MPPPWHTLHASMSFLQTWFLTTCELTHTQTHTGTQTYMHAQMTIARASFYMHQANTISEKTGTTIFLSKASMRPVETCLNPPPETSVLPPFSRKKGCNLSGYMFYTQVIHIFILAGGCPRKNKLHTKGVITSPLELFADRNHDFPVPTSSMEVVNLTR